MKIHRIYFLFVPVTLAIFIPLFLWDRARLRNEEPNKQLIRLHEMESRFYKTGTIEDARILKSEMGKYILRTDEDDPKQHKSNIWMMEYEWSSALSSMLENKKPKKIQPDVVEYMIRNGARFNLTDMETAGHGKGSLLDPAIKNGLDIGIIKLLVKHGTWLRDINPNRDTVLHAAVRSHRPELVRYFLGLDASLLRAKNYVGKTPLDIAKVQNDPQIVRALKTTK